MQVCPKCGEYNRNSQTSCTKCRTILDNKDKYDENNNKETLFNENKILRNIIVKCNICKFEFKISIYKEFDSFCCTQCRSIYYYEYENGKVNIQLIKAKRNIPEYIIKAAKVLKIDQNYLEIVDLKEAWRKSVLKYHPDKVDSMGEDLVDLAKSRTQEINEAYDILKKWKEDYE